MQSVLMADLALATSIPTGQGTSHSAHERQLASVRRMRKKLR
ncbi:MAG: hypothetical protein R2856_29175 [Caldilineaceae bacterium]